MLVYPIEKTMATATQSLEHYLSSLIARVEGKAH